MQTDGRARRQVLGVLGWVRRGDEVLLVRRHQPSVAALHGQWELPERTDHAILLVYDCSAGDQLQQPADPHVAEVAWRRPAAIDLDLALPSVRHFVEWWQAWDGNVMHDA